MGTRVVWEDFPEVAAVKLGPGVRVRWSRRDWRGLGRQRILGESGETVAGRGGDRLTPGWLRCLDGWREAAGRGPGLWAGVRSWT